MEITKVIDGGFCIGCGACAALDRAFNVEAGPDGNNRVVAYPDDPSLLERASRVCPFAAAPDETQIAAGMFDGAEHDEHIGRYVHLYAGHAPAMRNRAGSGGLTRWMIAELLRLGRVSFAVSVDQTVKTDAGTLFRYAVHTTAESYLDAASSSAYHPVTLADIAADIRGRDGQCVATVLPCFSRALRALMHEDEQIARRVAFISGVICGGLKSRRYAAYLAHQMGVEEHELQRINFRGKTLSKAANEKCVEVWRQPSSGPSSTRRVQDLIGTDYGSGYFKPKACDYCDDVFAETADIAFGDAWISPYKERPEGTNVVVVRNRELAGIFERARAAGKIVLDDLSASAVVASQASGLRHRRQGLAVRLKLARLSGRWAPRKRVDPGFGTAGFTAQQMTRILIRRVTSASWLSPESRWFHRAAWRLTRLHQIIRPWSLARQPKGLGQLRWENKP